MAASHRAPKIWFNAMNRKYFNSELSADTSVMWAPMDVNNGECQAGVIRLCPSLQGSPKLAKIVLLHECIHLLYPRLTHGKLFRKELDRLYSMGAFYPLL